MEAGAAHKHLFRVPVPLLAPQVNAQHSPARRACKTQRSPHGHVGHRSALKLGIVQVSAASLQHTRLVRSNAVAAPGKQPGPIKAHHHVVHRRSDLCDTAVASSLLRESSIHHGLGIVAPNCCEWPRNADARAAAAVHDNHTP